MVSLAPAAVGAGGGGGGGGAAVAAPLPQPPLPPLLPPLRPPPQQSSSSSSFFAVAALASRVPRSSSPSPGSDDAVRVVPLSRWDADDGWFDRGSGGGGAGENGGGGGGGDHSSAGAVTPPPPLPKRFGAFLDGAALVDARALSLSTAEASALDPQQRMLLECGAEALGAAPRLEGEREGGEADFFFFFFFLF